MTRFLKLVRHQDGKWKALPTETDDLAQVVLKERKYAPIDPAQLLKALDSLLSVDGGIRSVEDVPRLASLMKKFSKKLVSRCVYCNVLQATQPEILSEYLDKGGWETINTWLQYAKSSSSHCFLLEMLKLCKQLPMTLSRLKENNTAKLIKALTKHENSEVKTLSSEVVTKWMSIIKGTKAEVPAAGGKKKKKKVTKPEEDKKEEEKPAVETVKELVDKNPAKIKGVKRTSSEKEAKKVEFYEDVKIDPEPLLPPPKKPRPDRPKTVKLYQKKFRATGLEEATPLPKNIPKKAPTVDKSALAVVKNAQVKINAPDRILEKKIKPENLMAINENSAANKGIKLIPAKPRPHVLHESASFMDALISQPIVPVKRKKKVQPNKAATSPTSPTLTAPKLQFYKDTLEMNDEDKKEDKDSATNEEKITSSEEKNSANNQEESEPMDTTEEGGQTPPNEESTDIVSPSENSQESKDSKTPNVAVDPNKLKSILSHGRRRGRKKSVKWVDDSSLKEIFYFEMDENERVNVLRTQNFGDLKSIEVKREREAMELAKRQAGDRMEESTRWWITPILIDVPPPLVEVGCESVEKDLERYRQQCTLQEIYFTREMIPDSPHEPDLEIVPAQEPKVIPLDEENSIGSVMDYSNYKAPKPQLPEVLTSLIRSTGQTQNQNISQEQQMPNDLNNILKQPILNPEITNQQHIQVPSSSPYDPAEPVSVMPSNSLLGPPPPLQNMFGMSQDVQNMNSQNDWRPSEVMQPDQFFGGYMNPNMVHDPVPGMNMRPRMVQEMFRPPNMHKVPPRGMGPRPRNVHKVPCRHFIAGGCRFGMKCSFLHPGINGPPL
ncbi:serine/threonine-protein phosphatase 1 regulatory subunit 10-like isoform X3 [Stegodyphus dumicola]|uniref:serine/threonine-protein phosphatase 1 regulatory subunit 10-like isoform X3 n=1 Tax=Stegodyphus dumicola TaxID=202533 RepID=UPI0015A87C86|nr:serine/threonine-protein phosphatase 1 regulatory subunit 10-like isoform X3 [Stegodyphus dumicola]